MNVSIITALVSIVLAGGILLALNRANIFLLIILICSSFLGFVDPLAFTAKGLFDIHLIFLILIFITIITSGSKIKEISNLKLKMPIYVLVTLLCYGILIPVIREHSSIFYAFKSSKEFMMILWYFSAFLYIRDEKNIDIAWKYLIAIGIYYTILESIAQIASPALSNIITYGFRKEFFVFWKIYPPFWPFILILLFVSLYQVVFKIKNAYLLLFIGAIGLFFTFFRSYFLASIAVIPLVLVLQGRGSLKYLQKAIISGIVIITGILTLTLTLGDNKVLTELTDKFITSGITEISDQSGGALAGRDAYAEGLYLLRDSMPLTGYGFIDKDSSFGLEARKKLIGDLVGFIDKGTLDVTIKFGYIGGVILYGCFIYIAILLIRISKEDISSSLKARTLTAASITIVYLIVQPVHAPLTNSFALLPYMLALGLIERQYFIEKNLNKGKNKTPENNISDRIEDSQKDDMYESVTLKQSNAN